MISFVWVPGPFMAWAGGSEVYTLSHIAELRRRGIAARLVVHPRTAKTLEPLNVPVYVLRDEAELCELDDTLVFVLFPQVGLGSFKRQAYVVLHIPAHGPDHDLSQLLTQYDSVSQLPIVTSRFMAGHWQHILGMAEPPPVVYPPIDPVFARVVRPPYCGPRRLLFVGRPTPTKGLYSLMASLHMRPLDGLDYTLDVVKTVNNGGEGGAIINALVDAHPLITALPACKDRDEMARLYASHDVLVAPSIWAEPFCMAAAEAQHAGCRVVASDIGGLLETDCGCGGLVLVDSSDPLDLSRGIAEAIQLGPLTQDERAVAAQQFTVVASADSLLRAIGYSNHC